MVYCGQNLLTNIKTSVVHEFLPSFNADDFALLPGLVFKLSCLHVIHKYMNDMLFALQATHKRFFIFLMTFFFFLQLLQKEP